MSYRPTSLCNLAIQFQTRFLESSPSPLAGLKFRSSDSVYGSEIVKAPTRRISIRIPNTDVQDTKRPVTKRPVTKRPGYKTSVYQTSGYRTSRIQNIWDIKRPVFANFKTCLKKTLLSEIPSLHLYLKLNESQKLEKIYS